MLREAVHGKNLSPPQVPLYSYATTRPVVDRDALINVMAMQLSQPVLWVDLIRKLGHNHVNTLVEIGPGTMLSRSVRWIDRHITMLDTSSVDRIREVVQTLR